MTDTDTAPAGDSGPGNVAEPSNSPGSPAAPFEGLELGPGAGLEWSGPDSGAGMPATSSQQSDFSSHSTSGRRLTYHPGFRRGIGDSSADVFGAGPDPRTTSDAGTVTAGGRHPFDPDEARSTKAAAVLALGVAAIITGPLIGGLVPAALALILAREARDDLIAGKGYLTGGRQIRLGITLAWIGVALAVAALVAASTIGIISLAHHTSQDFPNTSD